MSTDSNLPLALYKANLALHLRLTALLQENGQQWLELASRAFGDGIAETSDDMQSLLQAKDWQGLASLPAESFWRQVQQRFGDAQATTQVAVNSQTALISGLQDAIQTWQKDTTEALGDTGTAAPLDAFAGLLQQMGVPVPETVAKKRSSRGR